MLQRALYTFIFIIAAQINLCAQEPQSTPALPCPDLMIECPTDIPSNDPDQPARFVARVGEVELYGKLVFNWTIEVGTILSGQGTSTIEVTGFGNNFAVAVEVHGLPSGCANTASCSMIWCRPISHWYDFYGNINAEDEMARLDSFAIELNYNPAALGSLIAYAGRRSHVNEARKRLERAKDYLVNTRGLSEGRIVIVDGGFREELTVVLHIVPLGADPPVATPTIKPEEVQIIRNVLKRTKRRSQR